MHSLCSIIKKKVCLVTYFYFTTYFVFWVPPVLDVYLWQFTTWQIVGAIVIKIGQKTTEKVLKLPLFYLAIEEIQSGKIQNNIYILNFPTSFSAEFCCSQDKRVGISTNLSLILFSIFLYLCILMHIIPSNTHLHKNDL